MFDVEEEKDKGFAWNQVALCWRCSFDAYLIAFRQ
jgi:hypothetical protein